MLEFADVVRIVQVSRTLPSTSAQRSHSPANAKSAPFSISKQYGCLDFALRCHSYKPSAGITHRCALNGTRNEPVVVTVSARALMDLKPTFGSVAHDGMSPQRS